MSVNADQMKWCSRVSTVLRLLAQTTAPDELITTGQGQARCPARPRPVSALRLFQRRLSADQRQQPKGRTHPPCESPSGSFALDGN